MDKTSTSTTSERAQQLFNKNIELERKRKESLQAKIPSDPNTWHQIRENCEAIILEDHAFSEERNIEFALWLLHYKRIEEFRAHFMTALSSAKSSATNNSRTPLQPDRITKIRVQFKAFLSEATGFYHDLILKIRAKYGLPFGHFSDDSDNLAAVGIDTKKYSYVKKALVSCHRCLIYLGDLARYKGQYSDGESRAREYSAASSYYLQAASLWPSNGNPHHQLAILATYSGDELVAVYRYFRSLAAEVPIQAAKDNLITAFEKNRQSYTQLLETTKAMENREASMKEKYKDFCIRFVRPHGILFSRTSLETFSTALSSVTVVLHELLSSGPEEKQTFGGDSMQNGLAIVRLVATLIFTAYNVNKKNEDQTYAEILQHTVLFENACGLTFEVMSLIIERCVELHDPSSSFLLPGILIFLEWLACCPNFAACTVDEKKTTAAKMSFWKHCIALLNKLVSSRMVSVDDDGDETCFTNMTRYEEGESDSRVALWEDFELRGFLPLLPAQSILEFSRKHSPSVGGSNKERRTRVKRTIAAGKALASVAMVDQTAVSFDSNVKRFIIGTQAQVTENSIPENAPSVNSLMMRENVQLAFEGDDENEEIVFKPVVVEKQMDVMGLTRNSFEAPQNSKTASPLTSLRFHQVTSELSMPTFNHIPLQADPVRDLHNSTWLAEQQASVTDGIKRLGIVENGLSSASNMKGSLGAENVGSLFPPQPSVSINTSMPSDYKRAQGIFNPSNMSYVACPEALDEILVITSASLKGQGSRPVRHLGPPPGFNHVPRKSVDLPVSNKVGTNSSVKVDDYGWLDGFQLSSTSNLGPSYATRELPLTNPVVSNTGSSDGHSGLPFSEVPSYGVQLQGGDVKSYSEYRPFGNMHPDHGQKLLQQQYIMAGNQFSSQTENYYGRPAWPGHYRV